MRSHQTNAASSRRLGFTLMEVMLVGGLMAFLAILLSSAWSGIGRSAVDAAARSQLLQELDMTVACLSRDLGGYLPIPSSATPDEYGGTDKYRLVGCLDNLYDNRLELCYDAGSDPDGEPDWGDSDKVVYYYLENDPDETVETNVLVREDENGNKFTVARCVDALSVATTPDFEWIEFSLTFKYPHLRAEHARKWTLKMIRLE